MIKNTQRITGIYWPMQQFNVPILLKGSTSKEYAKTAIGLKSLVFLIQGQGAKVILPKTS